MLMTLPLSVIPWDKWCKEPYQPDSLMDPITGPITTIVITLEEKFDTCFSPETCEEKLREVHEYYAKEKDCPRIPYSFIVGNDGNVYEGRGWQEKPLKSKMYNDLRDSTIDLGVIGRVPAEQEDAVDVLHRFVKECIEMKTINDKYSVVSFRGEKRIF